MFYGRRRAENIHQTLENSADPLIQRLYQILNQVVDHVAVMTFGGHNERLNEQKQQRYKDMVRNPMEFLLSIPYVDSAYIDPFRWGAYQFGRLCREDPEFWGWLEQNVKPPSVWYQQCWEDFKNETNTLVEDGRLMEGMKGRREELMVDEIGLERFKQYKKKDNNW